MARPSPREATVTSAVFSDSGAVILGIKTPRSGKIIQSLPRSSYKPNLEAALSCYVPGDKRGRSVRFFGLTKSEARAADCQPWGITFFIMR